MMSLIAVAVGHLGDAPVCSLKSLQTTNIGQKQSHGCFLHSMRQTNRNNAAVRNQALNLCFILYHFVLFYCLLFLHTINQKDGLHNKYTLPAGFIANTSLIAEFPRLDQWSENTPLSDASLFMDGFLYISSGPAKTTLERRGKDGEC